MLAEGLDLLGHLQRQLPCVAEHESGGLAGAGGNPLEQRNPERGGLSRAGLAPADDVPAGEDRLEHRRLDRSRSRISPLGDSLAQLLGERKISEAGGGDVIAHLGLNTKELACIAPHLPGI